MLAVIILTITLKNINDGSRVMDQCLGAGI